MFFLVERVFECLCAWRGSSLTAQNEHNCIHHLTPTTGAQAPHPWLVGHRLLSPTADSLATHMASLQASAAMQQSAPLFTVNGPAQRLRCIFIGPSCKCVSVKSSGRCVGGGSSSKCFWRIISLSKSFKQYLHWHMSTRSTAACYFNPECEVLKINLFNLQN